MSEGSLHPSLCTPLCELFGIQYPIVQTGMGWVAGSELTSATSEAGGMGILAAATLTLGELADEISKIKEHTSKPFGVNLRTDQEDIDKRVELLIRSSVHVASFAQAPGERIVKKLKDAGVLVVPTIGARRHAEKVAQWGVDALIAQGHEGGGHTGQVSTSILLPQVCDAVDLPVIGAGGFCDGRGLVAALAYGAAGIAMGTRFLMTKESKVPPLVKQRYLETKASETVVTKEIDGYPQRVIRTESIERLERAGWLKRIIQSLSYALELRRMTGASYLGFWKEGMAMRAQRELSWAQVMMAANAPIMTKESMQNGNLDVGILPTGQVVGLIEELPSVAEVIQKMMQEAKSVVERFGHRESS
jgi:NAD(P)H-dependent flavin oxidoreductase YrpB (nitropropane dioxygenase family)